MDGFPSLHPHPKQFPQGLVPLSLLVLYRTREQAAFNTRFSFSSFLAECDIKLLSGQSILVQVTLGNFVAFGLLALCDRTVTHDLSFGVPYTWYEYKEWLSQRKGYLRLPLACTALWRRQLRSDRGRWVVERRRKDDEVGGQGRKLRKYFIRSTFALP